MVGRLVRPDELNEARNGRNVSVRPNYPTPVGGTTRCTAGPGMWWRQTQRASHLYTQARSGLITGLALFPANNHDVTNPFKTMHTKCPGFQAWYCEHYMKKLSLKDNAACNGPTTCLPGSANDTAEKAQPHPKPAVQSQTTASVQVVGG